MLRRDQAQQELEVSAFIEEYIDKSEMWYKASFAVPWDALDALYRMKMHPRLGASGKPSRLVLGALILQQATGMSDREVVRQIRSNLSYSYFVGLVRLSKSAPFDRSTLSYVRGRLGPTLSRAISEVVTAVSEGRPEQIQTIVDQTRVLLSKEEAVEDVRSLWHRQGLASQVEKGAESEPVAALPPVSGKVFIDATVFPQHIAYPKDISLLYRSWEFTRTVMRRLEGLSQGLLVCQNKGSHRKVRTRYLSYSKDRKPSPAKRSRTARFIISHLRVPLASYQKWLVSPEGARYISKLTYDERRKMGTILKIVEQQGRLYDRSINSDGPDSTPKVPDRILSLEQPHVRMIARHKAGKAYESGPKVTLTLCNGIVQLCQYSFNNYNECNDVVLAAERHFQQHGHYPEAVIGDRIFGTKANQIWCQERNIRLSTPGQIPKNSSDEALKELIKMEGRQRNNIESKIAELKQRCGLERIYRKKADTSYLTVQFGILVANLKIMAKKAVVCWILASMYGRFRQILSACFVPIDNIRPVMASNILCC